MDGEEMVRLMKDITLGRKIDTSIINQEDQRAVNALIKEINEAKAKNRIVEWPDEMPS